MKNKTMKRALRKKNVLMMNKSKMILANVMTILFILSIMVIVSMDIDDIEASSNEKQDTTDYVEETETEVETTYKEETETVEEADSKVDIFNNEESTAASVEIIDLNNSRDWNDYEIYLLAKIAMAEAEGQDTKGKALVIKVVLNRVMSENPCFPDTIEEVIFQENQFSPIDNGRWDRVEPSEDCYKAVQWVQEGWDESQGALFFESVSDSTWHRDNLEYLFKHEGHYFYTLKSR